MLIDEGVDPAKIHAIGKLAVELPADHPLRVDLMALDRLSIYATATRYPSPTGKLPSAPDPALVASEIDAACALLARARTYLMPDQGG